MKIFDGYLLVSDMDGTLLNSKGKLSDENININNQMNDQTLLWGISLPFLSMKRRGCSLTS